jgi:hypothetical protein
MASKKKLGIPIVIGVALLAMFVLFPGIFGYLWPTTGSCEDWPYDPDCWCPPGDRKVYVPIHGIPKWTCETVDDLLIDPDSPTFEEDAIEFVQEYLDLWCGPPNCCTDLSCGESMCEYGGLPPEGEDRCIAAVFGWGYAGSRIVNVECNIITEWDEYGQPSSGYYSWRMNFFVESETGTPEVCSIIIDHNFCLSPDAEEICEYPDLPLVILPDDHPNCQ